MNNTTIYTIMAGILVAVSAWFMYLYLMFRQNSEETKGLRAFFAPSFDKRVLLLAAATLCIAEFVYVYDLCMIQKPLIKAFMNAEVSIWLATLGYIDWKEKLIPNEMVITGIAFWLILTLLDILVAGSSIRQVLRYSFAGGVVCGGVLFIIALVLKNALGMGDVKMFFVLGLLYGLSNTYAILFFSIVVMAVVSVIMLLAKKATRKTAIPMAPFVSFGFLACVVFGM